MFSYFPATVVVYVKNSVELRYNNHRGAVIIQEPTTGKKNPSFNAQNIRIHLLQAYEGLSYYERKSAK